MSHARKIGIAAVVAALVLLFAIAVPFGDELQPGGATKALSNVKQVGLALRLYADDFHGLLPASLQALLPDYISSSGKSLIDDLEFLTPGANLDEIDPKTPMLRSVSPIDGRVVVVRADDSVELRPRK